MPRKYAKKQKKRYYKKKVKKVKKPKLSKAKAKAAYLKKRKTTAKKARRYVRSSLESRASYIPTSVLQKARFRDVSMYKGAPFIGPKLPRGFSPSASAPAAGINAEDEFIKNLYRNQPAFGTDHWQADPDVTSSYQQPPYVPPQPGFVDLQFTRVEDLPNEAPQPGPDMEDPNPIPVGPLMPEQMSGLDEEHLDLVQSRYAFLKNMFNFQQNPDPRFVEEANFLSAVLIINGIDPML